MRRVSTHDATQKDHKLKISFGRDHLLNLKKWKKNPPWVLAKKTKVKAQKNLTVKDNSRTVHCLFLL
jgi:hypothetical protein